MFCGYYPQFLDVSAFRGYYPHFMDAICIGKILINLACNVCHVLYSFVLAVDMIFGNIMSYLACNVRPIYHILLI